MKKFLILTVLLCAAGLSAKAESIKSITERVFNIAVEQVKATDARLGENELPRSMDWEGRPVNSNYKWWCSGFFPGTCWYVYEYTGNENVKAIAQKYTERLKDVPTTVNNHDIGFMLWCSYGNAWRITGDKKWLEVPEAGAKTLAGRFNKTTKTIQSWAADKKRDWIYPVIIDNMMNLELLEEISRLCNKPEYDYIAKTHANTTLANHFRKDASCFHVLDYDPADGHVRHKVTRQGYNDASAWARGQAWALYGYTMMYRETKDIVYLRHAQKIADYILKQLPKDGIPYWDFNDDAIPNTLRDASAGAVMASALIELSTLVSSKSKANAYLKIAEKQIRTFATDEYLAKPGENGGFLLKHSVGCLPDGSEVNVPLTYADYYYLEALLRYRNLQ